jgi:DNA-directed RNA polymerase subunit RPC12/RpoP
MVTLQCTKCSHTFEKDKIPLICPYCGTKDSVKRVPSAIQILSDVDVEEQRFINRQQQQKK